MLDAVAFREDSGANGVHKRIHVDGHEVVLLDEDTLDRLDQALPFEPGRGWPDVSPTAASTRGSQTKEDGLPHTA